MQLEKQLQDTSLKLYEKTLKDLTKEQVYTVLLAVVKDMLEDKEEISGERKLYYFSAEFLIGKLMSNNLINLGIRKEVRDILADCLFLRFYCDIEFTW